MKEIIEIKNKMLKDKNLHHYLKKSIESMGIDENRPLGKFNPWAWWVAITRGCNLRCWHCAARLFPRGEYHHMTMETWKNLIGLIKKVSPNTRLEIGYDGEPTLNPKILDMFKYAKKEAPTIQLMMYTNGTILMKGEITYKDLFESGLNMIQVDMYSTIEKHEKLAKDSGYFYFREHEKPDDFPGIFTYNKDNNIHAIRLSNNPSDWIGRKKKGRNISTFFNNLDWDEAKKHNVYPVKRAPNRRCDLPSKFIPVCYDGDYTFCCFDFFNDVAGKIGNINNGIEEFFSFWLGEYMQDVRWKLYNKDRNSHQFCKTCAFTSIRCDIPYWKSGVLSKYWDGDKFSKLEDWKEITEDKDKIKLKKLF